MISAFKHDNSASSHGWHATIMDSPLTALFEFEMLDGIGNVNIRTFDSGV
jgi:hypothetical protein